MAKPDYNVKRDSGWWYIGRAVDRGMTWEDGLPLTGYTDREGAERFLGVATEDFDRLIASGDISVYGWSKRVPRFKAEELIELAPVIHAPPEPEPAAATDRPQRWFTSPLHLYLIEMIGLCVKVGVSKNPTARLASHAVDAKNYGRKIGRVWVSILHNEALNNEFWLKGTSRSEYLRRRSFDDVLEQALALPFTPPGSSHG